MIRAFFLLSWVLICCAGIGAEIAGAQGPVPPTPSAVPSAAATFAQAPEPEAAPAPVTAATVEPGPAAAASQTPSPAAAAVPHAEILAPQPTVFSIPAPRTLGTRDAILTVRTASVASGVLFIEEQACPPGGEVSIPLHHTTHHPVKYRITYGNSGTASPAALRARLTRDGGENWEELTSRLLKNNTQMPWTVAVRGGEHTTVEIYAAKNVTSAVVPKDDPVVQSLQEIRDRLRDIETQLSKLAESPGVTVAPTDHTEQLNKIEKELQSIKTQLVVRQQQADDFLSRLLFAPDSTRFVATAAAPAGKITGLTWTAHPVALRIAGPKSVPGSPLPEPPFTAQLRFRIGYSGQQLFTAPIPVTINASTTELQTEINFRQIIGQKLEQALIGQPLVRGRYTVHCEVEVDANGMRGYCGNYGVIEVE